MSVRDFWVSFALKAVSLAALVFFFVVFVPVGTVSTYDLWHWLALIGFLIVASLKLVYLGSSLVGYHMIRSNIKRGLQANGRNRNNR